jgi:small multidrug resistance pump
MSWLYLALAILLEVAGTFCLKLSYGFTHLIPSVLIFVFYGISFTFAAMAMKVIDLSVAYAIWSGVGTALAALIGVVYFKEPANALRIISVVLIVIGVVGLRLGSVAR